MKTINIKGKEYVEVKERILYLSQTYKEVYSIETKFFYYPEPKMWVVQATLRIKDCIYTGLAQEVESSNPKDINGTSALENCETSAVGRACAMAGIGVIQSITSADEVNKALNRQTTKTPTSKPIDHIAPEDLILCNSGHIRKYMPAGISKTGKPYSAFYPCSVRECKEQPIQAEDVENYLKPELKKQQDLVKTATDEFGPLVDEYGEVIK